jgi:hypothetical protein
MADDPSKSVRWRRFIEIAGGPDRFVGILGVVNGILGFGSVPDGLP